MCVCVCIRCGCKTAARQTIPDRCRRSRWPRFRARECSTSVPVGGKKKVLKRSIGVKKKKAIKWNLETTNIYSTVRRLLGRRRGNRTITVGISKSAGGLLKNRFSLVSRGLLPAYYYDIVRRARRIPRVCVYTTTYYIIIYVVAPCPRVCAEQFGVIWAQYQRGSTLSPALSPLLLSLYLSLSLCLPPGAKFPRRDWENKSQTPRLFRPGRGPGTPRSYRIYGYPHDKYCPRSTRYTFYTLYVYDTRYYIIIIIIIDVRLHTSAHMYTYIVKAACWKQFLIFPFFPPPLLRVWIVTIYLFSFSFPPPLPRLYFFGRRNFFTVSIWYI